MSAVTHHLPKIGYFDWSAFGDFNVEQKAQAVKMPPRGQATRRDVDAAPVRSRGRPSPQHHRRERLGRLLPVVAADPRRQPPFGASTDAGH